MLKVLLVEDSPIARSILQRMIDSDPDMKVVGTARTGQDAMELLPKLKPNIICTDLYMPRMDGLELTQQVMAKQPTPILVISAGVGAEDKKNVFSLLEAGAVDVFPKPGAGQIEDYEAQKDILLQKIRVLAGVKVFTKKYRGLQLPGKKTETLTMPPAGNRVPPRLGKPIELVAIGASTGGPQAFQAVLESIPPTFPVPILCVQHISQGFLDGFIRWLDQSCAISIQIAKTGEKPQAGKVYFPPDRQHLRIDSQGRFICLEGPLVDSHCPSVTVLFQSVAKKYGPASIGILLTGMGRDGASGLLELKQKGGYTIAQDEASSIVFGMPQEAIKLGAAKVVLPLTEIAGHLKGVIAKSQAAIA
ncbi:MAG: chemotaxis-specific protein-glutamate methyltransferase CheB [Synechocystis sp.]|nr:chemotaxis-specific protein-glutamate methyltransferase CheB [Synechocystis sp.]